MSGIYTGALGMISATTRLNTISNNIANSNTDGYKTEESTYRTWDEAYTKIESKNDTRIIGSVKDLTYVDNIKTNFEAGDAKQTGEEFDFYLQDDANKKGVSFFTVGKEDQTYLSRNGHYSLDGERNLVNVNGGFLLNAAGGHIQIPSGAKIELKPDGTISDQTSGAAYGKINIQTVDESHLGLLEKKYGGYYQPMKATDLDAQWVLENFDKNRTLQSVFGSKANVQDIVNTGTINVSSPFSGSVKNGILEASNVDLSKEMVDMIATQRYFQANSKTFSVMDQILAKEANEIGK